MLNEGPWLVFGQILLLHRFKLGINLNLISFDSYRIWFRLIGLPNHRRTETDIRLILHGYIRVNEVKPKKHQIIPPGNFRVQTTLPVEKRVPTGINLEEDDHFLFIGFEFLKLPP